MASWRYNFLNKIQIFIITILYYAYISFYFSPKLPSERVVVHTEQAIVAQDSQDALKWCLSFISNFIRTGLL